jgi:hypothetical protein
VNEAYALLFLRALIEVPVSLFLAVTLAGYLYSLKESIHVFALAVISIFIIKILPIKFGTHTILSILVLVGYMVFFFKINFNRSIYGALISMIALILSEWITLGPLLFISGRQMTEIVNDPVTRFLYGLPSLLLLYIFAWFANYRLKKRLKRNNAL